MKKPYPVRVPSEQPLKRGTTTGTRLLFNEVTTVRDRVRTEFQVLNWRSGFNSRLRQRQDFCRASLTMAGACDYSPHTGQPGNVYTLTATRHLILFLPFLLLTSREGCQLIAGAGKTPARDSHGLTLFALSACLTFSPTGLVERKPYRIVPGHVRRKKPATNTG
jgi:hypothetical protein